MMNAHDAIYAGHLGIDKTRDGIQRDYYWLNMQKTVRRYIKACDSCQRVKSTNKKPAGLSQPLEIPTARWDSISMDFITHQASSLPPSKTTDNAVYAAHTFFREIFRQHAMPTSIISDRDPKFTSKFWRTITQKLGIKTKLSSAYHPRTDGQTERMNRTLEDMLRHYTAHKQGRSLRNPDMTPATKENPTAEELAEQLR
ncbi:uncharacterized protein VTP21DRAFT_4766 [Calcarisporiella thermophila]|uniref:uncharacterized protein n=1 Tax=Calcarisporiella thermophila TaxID=911321 RepID=UPI0037425469